MCFYFDNSTQLKQMNVGFYFKTVIQYQKQKSINFVKLQRVKSKFVKTFVISVQFHVFFLKHFNALIEK